MHPPITQQGVPAPVVAPVAPITPVAPVQAPTPNYGAGGQVTAGQVGQMLFTGIIMGFAIGVGFIIAQKVTGKTVTAKSTGKSNFSGKVKGQYLQRKPQRQEPHPQIQQYQGSDGYNHQMPQR